MRESGILMHITSLPGPYGIGTMGKQAYRFVDFLESAGQSYWQILPLAPTGYGNSPYQCCSTFAGNHFLIDLDFLVVSHFAHNDRSRRVIEKCGFRYLQEGTFETQYDTVEPTREYLLWNPKKK